MLNFIYRINPIIPIKRDFFTIFPVAAELDYHFALKAREIPMPQKSLKRFFEIGDDIINKFGLKKFGSVHPYNFVNGSWLLHYCVVPGNACDLGLDDFGRSDFLENFERVKKESELIKELPPISYSPHNVDTKEQAFCLQSLWLCWAEYAQAVLE